MNNYSFLNPLTPGIKEEELEIKKTGYYCRNDRKSSQRGPPGSGGVCRNDRKASRRGLPGRGGGSMDGGNGPRHSGTGNVVRVKEQQVNVICIPSCVR